MINPEELRIGNSVQFRDWTKEEKYVTGNVISIDVWHPNNSASIVYTDNENALGAKNTGMNFDKLLPIPLTPEIIEKCGYEDCEIAVGGGLLHFSNGEYWTRTSEPYTTDEKNLKGKFVFEFQDNEYGFQVSDVPPIASLHQLQNLYFALTGEELIYKP